MHLTDRGKPIFTLIQNFARSVGSRCMFYVFVIIFRLIQDKNASLDFEKCLIGCVY